MTSQSPGNLFPQLDQNGGPAAAQVAAIRSMELGGQPVWPPQPGAANGNAYDFQAMTSQSGPLHQMLAPQQQPQQQQLNIMLPSQQQNLGQLVGQQQLGNLMAPNQQQGPTLSMMLQSMQAGGMIPSHALQSPPTSSNLGPPFMFLGGHRMEAPGGRGDPSPNSTPGLSMHQPPPAATPPSLGMDLNDRGWQGNPNFLLSGTRLFNPAGLQDKDLQEHLKNHSLGEMMHSIEGGGPPFGDPRPQMQFNDLRNIGQFQYVPAQSPPGGNMMQMPPRPRPEGGQDTSPNHFMREDKEDLIIGSWTDEEPDKQAAAKNMQFMIPKDMEAEKQFGGGQFGGWGAPPPASASPGGWGAPTGPNKQQLGTSHWQQPPPPMNNQRGGGMGMNQGMNMGMGSRGGRGGYRGRGGRGEVFVPRGGRGSNGRGADRGGMRSRGGARGGFVDHQQEKHDGKKSAVAGAVAMMKKMNVEDQERKEALAKEREERKARNKELGIEDPPEIDERAIRDDGRPQRFQRGDGRERRGRGRGRGGRGGPMMGGPPMFMPPVGIPPFPGEHGFLPPGAPPPMGPPPGAFPGSYPGSGPFFPIHPGMGPPFGPPGRGFGPRGRFPMPAAMGPMGFPQRFPPRGMPGGGPRGNGGRGRGRGGRRDNDLNVPKDEQEDEEADENNPLMNALTDKNEEEAPPPFEEQTDEVVPVGDEEPAPEPPKNVNSGQGIQLALPASTSFPQGQHRVHQGLDLRERLIRQLVEGSLECMVCLDRIKQRHAVWDCRQCYQIFHIHCIKKWSKTARETNGWRCPGCQSVTEKVPNAYRCFCRKMREPEFNPNETPHSCGDVCGKENADPLCPHKCVVLCHPGPCPPCNASTTKICACGKTTKKMKCGMTLLCGNPCDKPLNCGAHTCASSCHEGPCDECREKIVQKCFCGKSERTVPCGPETAGILSFGCGNTCDRKLDCGEHTCSRECHADTCAPCQLMVTRVTTCPCGQTPLEKIYERDGVDPRKSCLDAVPTCGLKCNKELECGQPGERHRCEALCHEGECPGCPLTTEVTCRCGFMDRELPCSDLKTRADDARCEKRCHKKRSCGRHKCGQNCCIDIDHTCTLVCGKLLSCGLHRCEDQCHRGNCATCPNVSFDDLTCHCGLMAIYAPVPCGTKPPPCDQKCTKSHDCDHPVMHNCHSEEQCPPCTTLTEKWCHGKHELRKAVMCHLEGLSCGRPCGRPLPCGRHSCVRLCHDGPCPQGPCGQPCVKPRASCGHPCNAPCHDGECPDNACREKIKVQCACGHLSKDVPCSSDIRLRTSLLAAKMTDNQTTIDLSAIYSKKEKMRSLECNEECSQIERNKRLALALQIENPELTNKLRAPSYSELMREIAKKDLTFAQMVHDKLVELVKLAKESKQRSRSYSFDCMNRDKRQFVHEYCEHFGCTSESFDAEPKRNVVATAIKDKSWMPSQSIVDVVMKLRKAPKPIMLTKDHLTSSSSMSQLTSIVNPYTSSGGLGHSASAINISATSETKKEEEHIDYFDFEG